MSACLNKYLKIACIVLAIIVVVLPQTVSAQVYPGPEQKNMAVSAIVPPTVPDFQFKFEYEGSSLTHQDQTLTYDITYGASSSAGLSTNNVIHVDYSADLGPDKQYLVDYVFGSATKGFGDTQPVIDTKNRTISWTLPSMPEGTMNQKVQFQLRTHGNQYDLQRFTFRSRAYMTNEYVSLPAYGVQQDYLFDPSLVTPGPTATPGPTIAPTPTPVQPEPRYYDVSTAELSQSQATLNVTTSKPTVLTVLYGTSPKAMTARAKATNLARTHQVLLSNLTPNTTYYYQIAATDTNGKTTYSDIFTFTTAMTSQPLVAGRDALLITSGDIVLFSTILDAGKDAQGVVTLATNTPYKLTYTLANPSSETELAAIVTNDQGIQERALMTSTDGKTFIANLRTKTEGTYNIGLTQTDSNSNVVSRKISTLYVSAPIRVLELQSSVPISGARVLFQRYNTSTKQYENIKENTIKNPDTTDAQGELATILAPGNYRIIVSAFGYQNQSADFTIGQGTTSGYPTVYLKHIGFDFLNIFQYLSTLFSDTFPAILLGITIISHSFEAFGVVATVSLLATITLSFNLFFHRTNIYWRELLPFFIFHVSMLRRLHHEEFLFGKVVDKAGKPLRNVRIELMHIKTHIVLGHGITTNDGIFRFENTFDVPYVKLVASKEALSEVTMIIPTDAKKAILVKMARTADTLQSEIMSGAKHFISGFFEIILILSLILELFFLNAFGVERTIIFVLLTFFNLACWIFYQRERGLYK